MRHEITRVRRETRRRVVTVVDVARVTPQMLRVTFASPDLHDFASDAHDDHIKVFFPGAAGEEKRTSRDFTPRRFDRRAGTLVIDFALHADGPSMQWASSAAPGQTLEIGGPRGSSVVPDDFDWYLFVGDETALPAIGRRIEELRARVPVTSVVAVRDAGESQHFDTRAAWAPVWAVRNGAEDAALLRKALEGAAFPPGDGFVWIAAEASVARALRAYVVEERGHPKAFVKASGYWKRGASEVHERIED